MNKALEYLSNSWKEEQEYVNSVIQRSYEVEDVVVNDLNQIEILIDEAKSINIAYLTPENREIYMNLLGELFPMKQRLQDRIEYIRETRKVLEGIKTSTSAWSEVTDLVTKLSENIKEDK